MSLSVVVTAHNEGDEVARTIESISATTRQAEIILVDDASTDGCCDNVAEPDVRLFVNQERRGVAPSRNLGAAVADGAALAFVDAHQRFSPGCLDDCAALAIARNAVVWPDVCDMGPRSTICHGARFRFRPGRGFYARWNVPRPLFATSRISSLKAPGYVMSRGVYEQVRWPAALGGWGGSEAAVSLKAFFLGIPILHLCGPLARHRFKRSFQYDVPALQVARNHALIARICFDERTWQEYWLPSVFAHELSDPVLRELDSPAIRDEQREFHRCKRRPDRDFWRWLLKTAEPQALRRASIAVGASLLR